MIHRSRCALAFLLLISLPLRAEELPDLKTRARLVADVAAAKPGTTFTAGVVLSMAPGWHTYWKNPGESGLATSIEWTLPAGVRAGEISWPIPEKQIESGDILTYAYSGEVMLIVPLTVSPTVPPGSPLRLKARVEWLECKETCVPGAATLELALPLSDGPVRPANHTLFAKHRERLPQPWREDLGFRIQPEVRHDTLSIRLVPAVPLQDFFPESMEGFVVGRPSVSQEDGNSVVRVSLTPGGHAPAAAAFRGVLVLDDGRRGVGFDVPIPAPAAFSGGLLDQSFETGAGQGQGGSLPLYILFAVIGGLILNIMPCVLPVIALKVFGLVRMAGDQPSQVKKLGWVFSAGILSAFLALALVVIVLQIAGQQVGWGFQFQEPLFVIAMSAIVFAFGLSLFGVYEIRVPGLAIAGVERIASAQQSGGLAASFWEGVFATILATPCTAPFLGSALGFAFSQPWWTILCIFAAVAAGMALPYLILTAKPAWMRHLPKPGAWMETAKQFMGFLMMATLLWLLYVLGKQLGLEGVIWTGAFLLCVGISCWLVGRFATLTASRRTTVLTWVAAVLIVAGGYAGFLEGVLDVRRVIAGTPPPSSVAGEDGIQWESFTLASLESRLREGKGVFLDFTADWCLTCKVNERTVLVDRDVAAKLRGAGLVAIKADWTSRNPEITRLLQKFGRSGVPLYVIFPAGRPTQPIILPEVITPGIVMDAVDRALLRP